MNIDKANVTAVNPEDSNKQGDYGNRSVYGGDRS